MTLRSAFAHDLPIAAKLNAVIVVAIAVVLGTAGIVLTVWLTKQLEERSLAELKRTNRQVVDMIDAYSVALERSAEMLGAQFHATLPRRVDFAATSGNLALVDAFTNATGGVATVFERRGDDFVRVATSLKKEDGERAMGTTLGSKHPAFAKAMAGEPYTGRATLFGRDYMTRYLPLKDEAGQVTGIAFIGVDFTEGMKVLKKKVLGIKVGETGYVFALDAVKEPGLAAIHPAAEGKNLSGAKDANGRLFVKEMLGMTHGVIRYDWANKERGETASREKVAVIDAFEKWGWIIGSGSYLDEFVRDVRWVLIQFAATGLIAAAALVAAVFFATRHWVSRPLGEALAVTRRVAAGDLTVSIDARGGDEVGQLLAATNDMCGQLRGMIGDVHAGVGSMAAGVGQLATAAQEVAEASGEQSAAANAMAAAVEEMTTSIDVVSSNAHDARTMAETSGEISGSGAAVIDSAIRGMGGIAATVRESSGVVAQLGEQSRQISGIVSVIREIADQTNLLALNAAIEAARAGEQGRGFAVVADEVRKLAERTAQSTEEITAMVERIQAGAGNAVESMAVGVQQVEEGVELANKAGASIAEIKTGAASVDSAVAGISQALREQTVAAQDIAANVARIAEQAERNHTRAQQTSATASDMEALAERLSQSIARFRTA